MNDIIIFADNMEYIYIYITWSETEQLFIILAWNSKTENLSSN